MPGEWRIANVPLFKKGERDKSIIYRPFVLSSVVDKLLGSTNSINHQKVVRSVSIFSRDKELHFLRQ